jgi:hypothetical protein
MITTESRLLAARNWSGGGVGKISEKEKYIF